MKSQFMLLMFVFILFIICYVIFYIAITFVVSQSEITSIIAEKTLNIYFATFSCKDGEFVSY